MIRGNSQQSQDSFDSSADLHELQRTESTSSLPNHQAVRAANMPQAQEFTLTPRTISKQKYSQSSMTAPPVDMFIGFKNGWGIRQIQINKSKLKRAKQFFESEQKNADENYYSVNIYKKTAQFDILDDIQQLHSDQNQFSMPCFKTVGRGIQVQISQQAKQKVHGLFNQIQSIRKSTKIKTNSKFITQSMMKTVNIPSKIKDSFKQQNQYNRQTSMSKSQKNQFLNWQTYEQQVKGLINKQMRLISADKRNTRSKRYQKNVLPIVALQYQTAKLSTLDIDQEAQINVLKQLSIQSKQIHSRKFDHVLQNCSIFHCVLCKIKYASTHCGIEQLYDVMDRFFAKKNISEDLFRILYEEVSFKLLKYQLMWPSIVNKRYHPSNLIVEINKKLLQLQKNPQSSYLRYCIINDQIGRKINVIIKQKQINSRMQIIFLKISDGWSSLWAVIEAHNYLYKYLLDDRKLRVGHKLSISLWNIHPISNILEYNNQNINATTCIEFHYNGSILLKSNARLGFTAQQFYRPLNRCSAKGGLIPVVQGTIIRLFKGKEKSKAKKNEYSLFSNHFAQILTPEGYTCLLKFVLGQQNSLVEYFRLYRSYHFYKVKINQDKMLSYLMDNSKYQQIKCCKISQKQQIYPESVSKLVSQRLINLMQISSLRIDQLYDVLWDGKYINMKQGYKIVAKIQNQKIEPIETLYQQFKLISIQKEQLIFKRQKYSSQLRRIPKIYQTIRI